MTTEDKKELLEHIEWQRAWHKKELFNKDRQWLKELHQKEYEKYNRTWEAVAQIEVKDEIH